MSNLEPIISPWIVYGIDVINKLCIVFVLAIVISGIGMLIVIGGSDSCGSNEQDIRILKILSVIFAVAVVFLVILPSKDTMLTMLALQYVTPDNIQAVQGNIVDFVSQIAQAVKDAK